MVITQRVLLDAPVDSWSRNFCVSLYYPDRDEPVHVYGADSEAVATAFLGDIFQISIEKSTFSVENFVSRN